MNVKFRAPFLAICLLISSAAMASEVFSDVEITTYAFTPDTDREKSWDKAHRAAFEAFTEDIQKLVTYDPYGDELFYDATVISKRVEGFKRTMRASTHKAAFGQGGGGALAYSTTSMMGNVPWSQQTKEQAGRQIMAQDWAVVKTGPSKPTADFSGYKVPVAIAIRSVYWKSGLPPSELRFLSYAEWTITAVNPKQPPPAAAAPAPAPASAPSEVDTIEAIRKYKELLDEGIITEEEFEAKKKELLES